MKKKKSNDFIKLMAIALCAICIFSAGFVGVNNLAFAAATNKTENLPPASTSTIAPAVNSISAEANSPIEYAAATDASVEYQKPTLTIDVPPNEWFTPSANALSPEEAAEIGARYIWDVFGESIDGKFVSLFYSNHPSNTKTWWVGTVADSKEAIEEGSANSLFMFTICGTYGERIDLWQYIYGSRRDSSITSDEMRTARAELWPSSAVENPLTPSQLEEYLVIAADYADRHFNNSNVTSIEFDGAHIASFGKDNDGNLFIADYALTFIATDDTGREAELRILMDSKKLSVISTQHNDIVPGYNFDAPGGLG